MTDLQQQLLSEAEALALDAYGCDLDRLDPDALDWYVANVTEANYDSLVADLAHEAWQAY